MTTKRSPPSDAEPQPILPHPQDREGGQPYAKEVEDYKSGVVAPPEEHVGREASPKAAKRPARK